MTSEVLLLCRICLQDGATCPIFDDVTKECGINSKLRVCFQEKVIDIAGFPRNICCTCNTTLDTMYDFITKCKHSHKILEGLISVKQENNGINNLEKNIFTNRSEDIAKILQNDIAIVKTECLQTFEISDSDNDCNKDNFMYELHIDNINEVCKKEPSSIKKDPAEILGSLSHLTIKKIKIENGLENQEFVSVGEKNSTKKQKSRRRAGLITKKKAVKKHVKGRSKPPIKPTKPNGGISKEQLRLRNLKHLQELEVKRKKEQLEKQYSTKLCDLCGDTYSSAELLSKHKRQKHAERNFKCTQCPKDYKTARDLNDHVAKQHDNIRTAFCEKCGKGFFTKKHLNQHVAVTHENKKRQPTIKKCKYCDRTFTYKRGVVIHERSVHTGERPSKCTVCDSAFYDDVYLAEHMRIHTGHAPYKCPVCQQGFTQRGNMKSHMRNHKISELDEETKSRIKPNHFKFMRP